MEYEALVRRHKDAVYRQMLRVCGNYDDAEDVLVEALLAAYRSLPQLKDEGTFRSWLAIVGRRACSRIQRQEALRPVLSLNLMNEQGVEIPTVVASLDSEAEMSQMVTQVKRMVAELPEGLREVYVARELQGSSAEETAKKLGISVAAVKSRLHRARGLVRASLEKVFHTS